MSFPSEKVDELIDEIERAHCVCLQFPKKGDEVKACTIHKQCEELRLHVKLSGMIY